MRSFFVNLFYRICINFNYDLYQLCISADQNYIHTSYQTKYHEKLGSFAVCLVAELSFEDSDPNVLVTQTVI